MRTVDSLEDFLVAVREALGTYDDGDEMAAPKGVGSRIKLRDTSYRIKSVVDERTWLKAEVILFCAEVVLRHARPTGAEKGNWTWFVNHYEAGSQLYEQRQFAANAHHVVDTIQRWEAYNEKTA